MKVIVAGGRDFNQPELMWDTLSEIEGITEIVCGKARGADTGGEIYAKINKIPVAEFPAQWDKYGKSAGYRRNVKMAEYADMLVAFWDGKSKGTKHMIDIATAKGLDVKVVMYNE